MNKNLSTKAVFTAVVLLVCVYGIVGVPRSWNKPVLPLPVIAGVILTIGMAADINVRLSDTQSFESKTGTGWTRTVSRELRRRRR